MEIPLTPVDVAEVNLANVSSRYSGKLVRSRVMVSKSSEIASEIYAIEWACKECRAITETPFSGTGYCRDCNIPMRKQGEKIRDFKEIEVEEILGNLDRQPERMKCKIIGRMLTTKKIEFLQAGDVIDLTAYVESEKVKARMDRIILNYYLLAEELKLVNDEREEDPISPEDIEDIKKLALENPITKLRDSLAPNIQGYDNIKTALLLQMVRGSENLHNVRPTIHILLCGVASVSKSKLAEASHAKMPRSLYGSGENMSKAGLIASMEKDALSGRWGVRAGTICRANKSIVVIDELDKLNAEDRNGLHTPMEMRKVLVDKAGIKVELSADASILGCCNPKNGKFDLTHMDSIQSQINLPESLMSRFDLIFVMLDKIDQERDEKILRSLMSPGKARATINEKLFKKYIKYASRLEPVIQDDVQDTIVEIVTSLRQRYKSMTDKKDKTPITFRQAGGLIRLATASAKLRLSDKVEMVDLKLAEELTLDALESAGFGRDFNGVEYAALYGGTTKKKMDLMEMVKKDTADFIKAGVNSEETIKKHFLNQKVSEKDFEKVWYQLRKEGTVIGPPSSIKFVN